jgi:hypothetical protein
MSQQPVAAAASAKLTASRDKSVQGESLPPDVMVSRESAVSRVAESQAGIPASAMQPVAGASAAPGQLPSPFGPTKSASENKDLEAIVQLAKQDAADDTAAAMGKAATPVPATSQKPDAGAVAAAKGQLPWPFGNLPSERKAKFGGEKLQSNSVQGEYVDVPADVMVGSKDAAGRPDMGAWSVPPHGAIPPTSHNNGAEAIVQQARQEAVDAVALGQAPNGYHGGQKEESTQNRDKSVQGESMPPDVMVGTETLAAAGSQASTATALGASTNPATTSAAATTLAAEEAVRSGAGRGSSDGFGIGVACLLATMLIKV